MLHTLYDLFQTDISPNFTTWTIHGHERATTNCSFCMVYSRTKNKVTKSKIYNELVLFLLHPYRPRRLNPCMLYQSDFTNKLMVPIIMLDVVRLTDAIYQCASKFICWTTAWHLFISRNPRAWHCNTQTRQPVVVCGFRKLQIKKYTIMKTAN